MSKKSVFASEYGQQVNDIRRGTPAWDIALIEGYLRERDRCAKPHWDLARELYEQDQFQGWRLKERYMIDQVQPPRVYGLVHQIESQVYNRSPKFYVSPMTPKQEKLAKWGELVMNTEWLRDSRLQKEARLCLRDCVLTGWGFMLSSVEGDYEKFRKQRLARQKLAQKIQSDPAIGSMIDRVTQVMRMTPDSIVAEESETTYEMDDRVWQGRVCSRRVSPDDIVIDPNATCLEDARWIGRVIYADYDSVMSNPLFQNTKGLTPTKIMNGVMERTNYGTVPRASVLAGKQAAFSHGPFDIPTPYQYVELYEIFERKSNGDWNMKVFARGHDKYLREEDAIYDLGCPYKMLRWNDIGARIFSVSDIQPVLTHIIEEREIRTRLHDQHMRGAVDCYAFDRTLLPTEEQIRSFTVEGLGMLLPMDNVGGRSIQQGMQLLPRNPQTNEAIAYLQVIERNIQDGTGLGANQMMQALKSETSATEAAEIARNAGARGVAKFSAFNDFIANVAHDRLKLAAQFYDPGMIAVLGGIDAAAMWMGENFTKADIQWGLNVTIEIGSMQPKNDQTRAQAITTALTIMRQDPIAAQMLNVPRIWQEFFSLLGFQEGSDFLNPMMTADAMTAMYQQAMMAAQMGGSPTGGAPQGEGQAMASGDAGMAQMGGGQL
jgi:hypothetical protein